VFFLTVTVINSFTGLSVLFNSYQLINGTHSVLFNSYKLIHKTHSVVLNSYQLINGTLSVIFNSYQLTFTGLTVKETIAFFPTNTTKKNNSFATTFVELSLLHHLLQGDKFRRRSASDIPSVSRILRASVDVTC
jgi:hypothetical protein